MNAHRRGGQNHVSRGRNGEKFSKPFHQGDQDTLKKSHAVRVSNTKLIIMGKPQGNFLRLQRIKDQALGFVY
jgi:hypothetical protein